ncbi:hypothetical protein PFISCL1PPCAC_13448, partial [Pristionchus fissidentatus]
IIQIPISISALQGLLLCFNVALHNYIDIFHDATFFSVSIGPLVPLLPKQLQRLTFLVAVWMTPMMWILIPATSV